MILPADEAKRFLRCCFTADSGAPCCVLTSCAPDVSPQRSWTWRTVSGRTFTSSPERWSCFSESFRSRFSPTATLISSSQPSVSRIFDPYTQVFKLTLLMYSYCIYNWLTTSVLLFQEFLTTTQNCLACMNWSKHFLLQITTPWSSFLGIYAGLFFFFKYLSFWFYYFIIFYFIFGLFPSVSEVETNKVQILSGSS